MSDPARYRATDARCFDCGLGEETLLAIQTFLLREIAAMAASTIDELVTAAKCFDCGLGRETLLAINAYLLNEIVAGGGGGPPGGLFKRRLYGHGDPNGVVVGYLGEDYLDQDTGNVWFKIADDGLSTGWGL